MTTPPPDASTAANVPQELPVFGVLLGIDYGTKRVGVAVSDRDQKFSSPLHNYQRQGLQADTRFFRNVVAEYRPVGIVVGLPIHLSGDESEKSREARKFAAWLSECTGLPHCFQDERFSSFQAEQLMSAADLTKKTTQRPNRQTGRTDPASDVYRKTQIGRAAQLRRDRGIQQRGRRQLARRFVIKIRIVAMERQRSGAPAVLSSRVFQLSWRRDSSRVENTIAAVSMRRIVPGHAMG